MDVCKRVNLDAKNLLQTKSKFFHSQIPKVFANNVINFHQVENLNEQRNKTIESFLPFSSTINFLDHSKTNMP